MTEGIFNRMAASRLPTLPEARCSSVKSSRQHQVRDSHSGELLFKQDWLVQRESDHLSQLQVSCRRSDGELVSRQSILYRVAGEAPEVEWSAQNRILNLLRSKVHRKWRT